MITSTVERLRRLSPLSRLKGHRPRGWRSWFTAVLMVLLIVATVGGLVQVRVDTGIGSFLPAGDSAYEELEDKARSFGGDPVVVLLESSKPQELLLEQEKPLRLLQLEGSLSELPDVAGVYGPATVLNQIAGGAQNLLAQISGRRDSLRTEAEQKAKEEGADEGAAKSAGEDAVTEFDRRYATLMVEGLPAGLPTLRNPSFVGNVLFTEEGQPRSRWAFVLPADDTVAVLVRPREDLDQAAAGRLAEAVRSTVAQSDLDVDKATVTGVPVVTSGLTERAQRELPVLGAVALVAVGLVFFCSPWSRRRRSRLRPVASAVVGTAMTVAAFGWVQHPVSLGVVAFLPVILGIGSDFPFYLSQPGRRRRVIVAALAAAAGFGSLALSPLPFVRELGLAVATGIVATVVVALGMRALFGVAAPAGPGCDRGSDALPRARLWKRIVVIVAAVGVAGIGWMALPQLDVEAHPNELVGGLPELEDARHAEQVLGSAGEVSIVLRGENVVHPDALAWTRQAEDVVVRKHGDEMHRVITMSSLLQFLGDDPTDEQIAAGARLLPDYLSSAVIQPDRNAALMAFGIQVRDVEQQRALLAKVREALPPPPEGFEVEIVGLPVAAVRGFDLVSDGRVVINTVGVVAAGLVLLVGLPRRRDAGRAILTVLLATGWVLALAWSISGVLSPLTVAIASLTTATGCEFAVMLANDGRLRRSRLWRGVGTAALAGSVGYLVLALSGIGVLREFGLLLAASVAFSFLAALAVLWALPSRSPSRDDSVKSPRTDANTTEVAV